MCVAALSLLLLLSTAVSFLPPSRSLSLRETPSNSRLLSPLQMTQFTNAEAEDVVKSIQRLAGSYLDDEKLQISELKETIKEVSYSLFTPPAPERDDH